MFANRRRVGRGADTSVRLMTAVCSETHNIDPVGASVQWRVKGDSAGRVGTESKNKNETAKKLK